MNTLAIAALALWLLIAALPWRPWSVRERLEAGRDPATTTAFPDTTVIIPARNEAGHIASTLAGLRAQGSFAAVVVVDDESDDDTAAIADSAGIPELRVLRGSTPPPGWSGKLWALQQGAAEARSERLLLLDADISLAPGIIAALRQRADAEQRALASLMVELRIRSFWDRLLLPAFIYFFRLLYPFHLANGPGRLVAAAAGGCILLRRDTLARIGGFEAIRGAIIDDCSLARAVKNSGERTGVWLTTSARSTRACESLRPIWDMVARTAYTQLLYSPVLLALCTGLMLLAFAVPLAGVFSARALPAALAAWLVMAATYLPTLRLYRLHPAWALGLPLAGLLYLAMTWDSARRCWQGERSRWKARSYARHESGAP